MKRSGMLGYEDALENLFHGEFRQARAIATWALDRPCREDTPLQRARMLYVLATVEFGTWPTDAGYGALSEVIELSAQLGPEGALLHAAALNMLADFLETCHALELDLPDWAQGQPAPETLAQEAFNVRCRHLGEGHPSVGASYLRSGRYAEAIAVYENACGRQCLMLAEPLKESMAACLEAGQVDSATVFADRLATVWAHHFAELLPETLDDIAEMFSLHGGMEYAKQLLDRILEQRMSDHGCRHLEVAASHIYLSGWNLRADDYDGCRHHAREAIDILKATDVTEGDRLSRSDLVDNMVGFFRPLEACCEDVHEFLRECGSTRTSPFGLDRPYHLIAWSFLRQGDKPAAIRTYREGIGALEAQAEPDPSSVRVFINGIRHLKGEPLVL